MKFLARLRPYGRPWPRSLSRINLRAWWLGFKDGWRQPREVGVSVNIDHMLSDEVAHSAYDSLDAGMNAGQWLRSPLNHQQPDLR